MQKLLFIILTAFASLAAFGQESQPLDAAINFAQFNKAVYDIQLDCYQCTSTIEYSSAFSSQFAFDQYTGHLGAFHLSHFDFVTGGDDQFIPVKEYQINGNKAFLGTNNINDYDNTPMNILVVLYPELCMTILIDADPEIPIESLEEIVKQLVF